MYFFWHVKLNDNVKNFRLSRKKCWRSDLKNTDNWMKCSIIKYVTTTWSGLKINAIGPLSQQTQ